ncbi:MAG TPA: nickel-dependent lactate racemase [Firmicutes bacterium]|jgi:lactate racemase|nr:nickel-dependent lactate racemase [Bacillota bacterium]
MNPCILKYGKTEVPVAISDSDLLGVIDSHPTGPARSEAEVIREALEHPINSPRLKALVKPGEKVCIIISDITRAWQRMSVYLPFLVNELNEAGIRDQDILFLSATGTHRKHTPAEHQILLGPDLAKRFSVIDHDCRDTANLTYLGTTSYGTPVTVNKAALTCDHIIITGAIVYHLLAGWSGGKKSLLPGIASYETIMANHAMSLNPKRGGGSNPAVGSGKVIGNPVHEDMLETAAMVKPSFLFNVIMDPNGRIGHAVAGDFRAAHSAGCRIVDEQDRIAIPRLAELTIASAGGYPKDINFYQAIKSILNVNEAIKPGGAMIILAQCHEGLGDDEIQEIIQNYDTLLEREDGLRANYSIAKFVGYYVTEIASHSLMILVSEISPDSVANANIRVVKTLDEALAIVAREKGEHLPTYLMPHAGNTMPVVAG